MKCLIAVGACYLDTILTVDDYPGEDEKLRALSVVKRRGGNSPNTLEVLQQLIKLTTTPMVLVQAAVLASTSSAGTRQILASFEPSVDLTHCIYRPEYSEPASSYIIKSSSTDSRTIVNYNELPEMTTKEFIAIVDQLSVELDKGASWYHFEGRIPEVTLECIHYLRHRFPTVEISVELEKPARVGLQDLAVEADVVFYSKSWALGNGYQGAEDCLRAQACLVSKASLLFCTWGAEGASALELPSLTYSHSPAYVEESFNVVDTIGAGDTFTAGVLYGLTCHKDDWALLRKLEFANKLAGRKVAQEGFAGLGSIMHHDLGFDGPSQEP